MKINRRQLIKTTAMSGVMPNLVQIDSAYALEVTMSSPAPPAVGYKFDGSGNPLPFLGNTIVCPIEQYNPFFQDLVSFQQTIRSSMLARYLAFLPPRSFHMTLFEGVTDFSRKPGLWPASLPLEATMTSCHRFFLESLRHFDAACDVTFSMRVADQQQDIASASAIVINLEPADDKEDAKMRGLRDRLSKIMEIRARDHERYQFHTSQAYVIRSIPPDQIDGCRTVLADATTRLRSSGTVIRIGNPGFCFFDDMFEFRPRIPIKRLG